MKNWLCIFCLVLGTIAHAGSVPSFYGALKQISINNATIAFYRFGHGKPLVLINGHGDNMSMWHPVFLKNLSKNREIIIFDYSGIGKSIIHGDYPNTMEQFSVLVQSFINSQKLEKPDLLGFSMGGSLTLYMATEHSENYNHVIVVGAKAGGKKTVVPLAKNFNMLSDPTGPLPLR